MAHNIAQINGRAATAYIDATPWHGLGQNILKLLQAVLPAQYVDVALDAAQMRYTVGSEPLSLTDGTPVPNFKASVRYNPDGSIAAQLGVVGEGYTHVQNERAVSIARVLCEVWGCVVAACGVLGLGERCWMLLRLADATITPLPGDDSRGYFLLTWGHDGNLALSGLGSVIRVVCQNTLGMAMSASGGKHWFKIGHTSGADARIDQAAKVMDRLMASLKVTGDTFAKLAQRPMNAAELQAYIAAVIPAVEDAKGTISPKLAARRAAIAQLMVAGRGADIANQAMTQGTVSAWAAYNGVTEYFDHVRPAEAKSDAGRHNALMSAIFGENADTKIAALNIARKLVTV